MSRAPSACPIALGLLVSGCFNPTPFVDTFTTEGGSGETDTLTGGIDSTTDPDDTGPDPTGEGECGNGVVDAGEDCDDMGESATCDADCTPAMCGDMTVNAAAREGCDDGNMDGTDACVGCVLATCGDGIVWVGTEECDDANTEDSDDCTNACTSAACGDGIVWSMQGGGEACDDGGESASCNADCSPVMCGDGVVNATAGEECDDGNLDHTDTCVGGCVSASCGDGYVQAMIEECDDGNLNSGDGCDDECALENLLRPNVMVCGMSSRDVTTFFPMGKNFNLVMGCTPDMDTQALLIPRSGAKMIAAATLGAYVDAGGIVLTEYAASDTVFSSLFVNVVDGSNQGSCTDRIPLVFQFSPGDPFWADNAFNPIPVAEAGCGRDVSAFPGITPLAGWTASAVAIAYRDRGAGRLWLTDFDWQDGQGGPMDPSYADTLALMGYMITHRQ